MKLCMNNEYSMKHFYVIAKDSSIGGWLCKLWCIHMKGFYGVLEENKKVLYVTNMKRFHVILLSENIHGMLPSL